MKKRALISVYDKKGIVDLACKLEKLGYEIVSTGGTYRYLKENGVSVIEINDVTGFPEILDGRVKTLNPMIHGGILFRRDLSSHVDTIKKEDITPIDIVVNNLYPFEEKLLSGAGFSDMIENIDIGGPSMIRAAAKNFNDVIILTNPCQYENIIKELEKGAVSSDTKKRLASEAFSYTAYYDSLISNYFNNIVDVDFPEYKTNGYKLKEMLRYGENPHQKAAYYIEPVSYKNLKMDKLHGKDLSYNNLRDIEAAVRAVSEFKTPAVVGLKHTNPCGIGADEDIHNAYMKAYECDTESIFGGIIAFNREVDEKSAEHMASYFLEVIIAPSFSEKALEILKSKKNLRLIEIPSLKNIKLNSYTSKEVLGGIVYQEKDEVIYEEFDFSVMTTREPTEKEKENIIFALNCVKSVASNGVVIARDNMTIGIGQGEVRRSWAVEEAISRAKDKGIEGAVLASDAFFFEDSVEVLHNAGVEVLVSPGGSIKDDEVIRLCNEYNMCLIFTGKRHFRH